LLPLVPLNPIFVNRTRELAEFDTALTSLSAGVRRHLALLGLRRIGKTLLLDEVRRRHRNEAIAYLSLDEVVSSPEDFARALAAEVLRASAARVGKQLRVLSTTEGLRAAAVEIHPDLAVGLEEIGAGLRGELGSGALIAAAFRLPAIASETLGIPILIMLDEFQEIVRLGAFPNTSNLLGAVRAALDRPGRVGFAVAGSRVSAMRKLIGDGESPLFTRFEAIPLGPFGSDGTHELATIVWSDESLAPEPDAAVRLHRLTGGWPFYTHAVAARAAQIARAADGRISPDLVDLALYQEVIGRVTNLGQNCRYLLETATRVESAETRNTMEAILRFAARSQPIQRARLVRGLLRHHAHTTLHGAVNALIATDFLLEEQGLIRLADPVFGFWLTLEEQRRDPQAALGDQRGLRRLIGWYETRHAEDRQEMGRLFERRVENVLRQFDGREVDGELFGASERIRLPRIERAGSIRVDDPTGRFGDGPDTYEMDVVGVGDKPDECWMVEAKHRQGAITLRMVERFVASARAIALARGLRPSRLWIVAPRGIRPDAQELARRENVLTSGMRQLQRLERSLGDAFESALNTADPGA
jgi:AAA+ ATPase superfamily predicted ATPase